MAISSSRERGATDDGRSEWRSRRGSDGLAVLRYAAVAVAFAPLWALTLLVWPPTREVLGGPGAGFSLDSPLPYLAFASTTAIMSVPLWPWLDDLRWRGIVGLGFLGTLGGAVIFVWILFLVDLVAGFGWTGLSARVLVGMSILSMWGFVLASPVAVPIGILCVACLRWAKTGRIVLDGGRKRGRVTAKGAWR